MAIHLTPRGIWTPDTKDRYCYIRVLRGERRAFVYRPDHPQADKKGWIQRSRVVWWLAHDKQLPPDGFIVHHDNEDTLDDRPENLKAISVPEHVKLHHEKQPPRTFTCPKCGKDFELPFHIYNEKVKRGYKLFYCSGECYWKTQKGRKITRKVA